MSATARRAATALAAVLFVVLSPAAHAQVTSGGALEKVDAWGKGWLSRNEGALATTLWANTNGATLTELFRTIKPAALSPAGRQALRRIVLSAGKAPASELDLLSERVRLMEELGESEKSIELRRLFPNAAWAKGVEADATERDLAAGYSQNACARTTGKPADDIAWVRVRAACFAKAGDFNAAAAVAEIAARDDKTSGPWLVQAVESMRETTKTKPQGRFGSAFEAAMSIFGKLQPANDAFRNSPPDIAALVVTHKEATPEQKSAALRAAVDAGLVKPADVRAALLAAIDPAKKSAKPDYIALALTAAENDKLDAASKATAYAVPLKMAATATDFRVAAFALSADTAKLPKSDPTLAETFARAALTAGDLKQAQEWRAAMDKASKDKADPWAAARLDLMFGYAGGNADTAVKALSTLASALPAPDAKAQAAPARQGQADLRRIEATRALFLHVGAGRSLSPTLRTLLAAQRSTGRGVPDAPLARMQAALTADAKGEAAMAAIAQLGADPSALSFSGLSQLLVVLDRAGLDKDADAVALEALQVWKSF